MIKNAKILVSLVVVLAICAGAYFGITAHKQRQAEKKLEEERASVITVCEIVDVVSLTYFNGETDLSFNMVDKSWKYAGDNEFPLNTSSIYSLTNAVKRLVAERRMEATDSLAAYGLDNPQRKLTVTTASGESHTILIGNKVSYSYYAMMEGDSAIYVIDSTIYEHSSKNLTSIVKLDSMPEMLDNAMSSFSVQVGENVLSVDKISLKEGDVFPSTDAVTGKVTNTKIERDSLFWVFGINGIQSLGTDLKMPIPDNDPAYTESLNPVFYYYSDILSQISSISFKDCVAYKPTATELLEYGFGGETAIKLTAVVPYYDEDGNAVGSETYVVNIGDSFSDEDGNDYYYIMNQGGDQVCTTSASPISKLIASFGKFFTAEQLAGSAAAE